MFEKKERVEVPKEIAARALFESDRTCCVCRQRGKPVVLHHIDNDPGNSFPENLAVLCFDCHRETQISGGFDRKLDASQVVLYRDDWIKIVSSGRAEAGVPRPMGSAVQTRTIRYLQAKERNEEFSYDIEVDYPLIGCGVSAADLETNATIEAFLKRVTQRFRADAISRTAEKKEMKTGSFPPLAYDSLWVSHNLRLFTSAILSLEFQLSTYCAGAAHPNSETRTLNFRLRPSMEIELRDLFKLSDGYLTVLSHYCIKELRRQQLSKWHDPLERAQQLEHDDHWMVSGAGPEYRNFERFSLVKGGLLIHFDPYQVACYAEGKYEVFVPSWEINALMRPELKSLLGWG